VYNRARFVCEALDSIAAQTRLPDEVVVVDDGSTDNSVVLVNAWIRAHPVINCKLIQQSNAGAAAARNAGIVHAVGECISFLDSDDLLADQCIEKLAHIMERSSEPLVMCFGDRTIVQRQGADGWTVRNSSVLDSSVLGRLDLQAGPTSDSFFVERGLFESLLPGTFIHLDSVLVRKSAAVAAGLFPVQFKTSEDRLFFLRIVRSGKTALIRQPLSVTRLHSDSLTSDAENLEVAKNGLAVLEYVRDSFALTLEEQSRVLELIKLRRENLRYCASTKGKAYFQFALSRLLTKHDTSFLYDLPSIGRALMTSCGIRKHTRGGDSG
jgi:glycosyltransferase involved in cell wall biosynthesis